MGRDFEPYRPRPVVTVGRELGNTFGAPSTLIEFPVSWFLDDFPALEYIPRSPAHGRDRGRVPRLKDHFDFAYHARHRRRVRDTVHPQTIAGPTRS